MESNICANDDGIIPRNSGFERIPIHKFYIDNIINEADSIASSYDLASKQRFISV